MTNKQIDSLLRSTHFKKNVKDWKLIETHISFVLLGNKFAYKFKKAIKYSFLDFSTLKKRKYFCERELELNNRLSKGIYLKVLPVTKTGDELMIAGKTGAIVDYTLQMKKLQGSKQMHLMLKKKQVTKKHIERLAVLIRNFHERTSVINNQFKPEEFAERFNDLSSVSDIVKKTLGPGFDKIIKAAIRCSDSFLKTQQDHFKRRAAKGFIRDCHGDLHSRNIFLYHNPIVFDCLEFNDAFRHTDILDELAFFCMDLEAEGFYDLSKAFTNYYFSKTKAGFGKPEQLLFTYYKCYRANVRAKVNALRAMQASGNPLIKNLADVEKYLVLMNSYLKRLT